MPNGSIRESMHVSTARPLAARASRSASRKRVVGHGRTTAVMPSASIRSNASWLVVFSPNRFCLPVPW